MGCASKEEIHGVLSIARHLYTTLGWNLGHLEEGCMMLTDPKTRGDPGVHGRRMCPEASVDVCTRICPSLIKLNLGYGSEQMESRSLSWMERNRHSMEGAPSTGGTLRQRCVPGSVSEGHNPIIRVVSQLQHRLHRPVGKAGGVGGERQG